MKVLVVDDDAIIRQFCSLIIDNITDNIIIQECKSSLEAIEVIKADKDFSLIVCDQEMPGGSGDLLVEFLVQENIDIPFIYHTSCYLKEFPVVELFINQRENCFYLQKPTPVDEFKKCILKIIKEENIGEEYKRIRILHFLRFNKTLCDVYIKLDYNNKFLKIINADERYHKSDIDKYIDKSLNYLYIKREDFERFSKSFQQTPFLSFINDSSSDKEDQLVRVHEVLRGLLLSVGIDKNVPLLAEKYFNNIDKLSRDNEELSKLLFQMRSSKNYLYEHSYLTASIGCYLLSKMEWANRSHSEKLCQAALLHDITITDPEIALVHDLDSSQMRNFSKEEIQKFKNHPHDVVNLLREESYFGPDVEYMILAHHDHPEKNETHNMIGQSYGGNIRPLAAVFVLAHEFTRLLYLNNFDEDSHRDILTYLFNAYNVGNYKDVLNALYETLELSVDTMNV